MKKNKEKILMALKDNKLYILFAISIIFFGAFSIIQYAPDTYSVFVNGTKETIFHFFSCGRFITGFVFAILKGILKLNGNTIYIISYATAIICTTLSLYKLYLILKEDIKSEILCILISTLIIINPFSIELFLYVEKGIMMFSILMCIIAIEKLIKFLNGDKKAAISMIIYILLANCSYQGTVGIFVVISLIYILKYSKTVKQFLVNNILVALFYLIPAIANFLLIKVFFSNNRLGGEVRIVESLNKIIQGIMVIFKNNYRLLPDNLFSIIIIAIICFILYLCIKNRKTAKQKLFYMFGAIYIIIGTIIVTIAPQILQNTDSIWFVARSTYPIASIIGILVAYVTINFELNENIKRVIIILICVFLGLQLTFFMKYTIDGYIVNYQDKQNATRIIEKINNYENETGIKVEKIAFYNDNNPNYTYLNINSTGDINIKAFFPEWSSLKILEFYSGRNLSTVEKNVEIEHKFNSVDWNYYDDSQIEIIGDTIHLCNY